MTAKVTHFGSNLRQTGAYFDVSFKVSTMVPALLGIGRYPIVYQFWFLRNLIVIVFLAFFLCRYFPRIPLLAWLFFFIPSPNGIFAGPPLLPIASCLAYYLVGYELHSILSPSQFPSARPSVLYCICWLCMGLALLTGHIAISQPLLAFGSAAFIFMFSISISQTAYGKYFAALAPFVFFLYATQEPLQTFLG